MHKYEAEEEEMAEAESKASTMSPTEIWAQRIGVCLHKGFWPVEDVQDHENNPRLAPNEMTFVSGRTKRRYRVLVEALTAAEPRPVPVLVHRPGDKNEPNPHTTAECGCCSERISPSPEAQEQIDAKVLFPICYDCGMQGPAYVARAIERYWERENAKSETA